MLDKNKTDSELTIEAKEITRNALIQANEILDRIERMLTINFARRNAKTNYHLRNNDFYYNGTMKRKDGTAYFRDDGPRDIYINLEPYCYEKINHLLAERKIRFKNSQFIIID